MTAKEMFIEFITVVFFILLIIFILVFFILGDRMGILYEILKMAAPMVIFFSFFMIKMQFSKINYRKRKREQALEVVVYLNYWDKIKSEIIVFLIPIMILLLPVLDKSLDATDIFQAIIAFGLAYLLHLMIFKKEKY